MIVKNTSCPSCGGQKITPSLTFYVYCDYCGVLMDLDFNVFVKALDENKEWNSRDKNRFSEIAEEVKIAEEKQDYETFKILKKEWLEIQIRNAPKTYPPRIKDEIYKKKYIEWMVATEFENTFNPKMKALYGEIMEKVNLFRYSTVSENGEKQAVQSAEEIMRISKEIDNGNMENMHVLQSLQSQFSAGAKTKQIIESKTFWSFFKTMMELVPQIITHHNGLVLQCPDQNTSLGFNTRLTAIAIVQGYIPWLTEKDIDKLINNSGLNSKYHTVAEPNLTERHCGGCGNKLFIVDGAKSVLCDGCGALIDVASSEFPCTGCGISTSFPVDKKEIKCTTCQSMIVKI